MLGEALTDADGEIDGLAEGLGEADGETDGLTLGEADGLGDAEGETDGLALGEGEAEALVPTSIDCENSTHGLLSAVVVSSSAKSEAATSPTLKSESWSRVPDGSPPVPTSTTILSPLLAVTSEVVAVNWRLVSVVVRSVLSLVTASIVPVTVLPSLLTTRIPIEVNMASPADVRAPRI